MNYEQTMNNLVILKKKKQLMQRIRTSSIYLLFIHKEMKATHQWVWIDSCHNNSHSSYRINLSNCVRVGRVQEHWCIFIFADVDGHSGVGTLMGNTIITGLYSQLQNRMTKLYTLCQSFFHVIFPTFFSPNFYQFSNF